MYTYCALCNFTRFEIRLDTVTLFSCPTLIFAKYLIFITATSEKPDSQRYDVTKKNTVPFNVEIIYSLKSALYPTDVELSLSLPQFPYALATAHGVPRHTAWESQHSSFKSQQLYKLVNILITSNKINYKNVFEGLKITLLQGEPVFLLSNKRNTNF